jgi:F0F1-type ATP synthase membrane subunit b/b'
MAQLLGEILRQIANEPLLFIAEVVQSAILIAIIVWAGRRYAPGRLTARKSRIAAELEAARTAESDSQRIREEAVAVVTRARESAEAIRQGARQEADKERATSAAAIEAEAHQVVEQARKAVDAELTAIRRNASERLVQLTTETARRYLDEMLGESERRLLTQKAILAFLDQVEAPAGTEGVGAI